MDTGSRGNGQGTTGVSLHGARIRRVISRFVTSSGNTSKDLEETR